MQIKFGVLKDGDVVLNVWQEHIAVKRASGEVEIYQVYLDERGLPRLSENTILVTQGDNCVTAVDKDYSVTTF